MKDKIHGPGKIEKFQKMLDEMTDYEDKHEFKLPKWYKGWLLANKTPMSERPPEYAYAAMYTRKKILKILNNREWFVMLDPARTLIDLQNILDNAMRVFKTLTSTSDTKELQPSILDLEILKPFATLMKEAVINSNEKERKAELVAAFDEADQDKDDLLKIKIDEKDK